MWLSSRAHNLGVSFWNSKNKETGKKSITGKGIHKEKTPKRTRGTRDRDLPYMWPLLVQYLIPNGLTSTSECGLAHPTLPS